MSDVPRPVDLAIVGAGPAGISAAVEATARGLSVLVLDENAAPGGRIWQALERRGAQDEDDVLGLEALREFRACPADARYGASVWAIEPDNHLFWSENGTAHSVPAGHVLLATGTTERPMPISGWTLPGVMTVGAAQIALKTAGLVPAGNTWIVGQGPLLLLYAVQALRAGGKIAGVLDTARPLLGPALRHLPRALPAWGELRKGVAWKREIARAGIPWLRASDLKAEGNSALSHIRFVSAGREHREPADLLLLHDGVIPSVQISRAAGCAHQWSEAQRSWHPAVDPWGRSSRPKLWVAGDGAGIAGAQASALSGRIAALAIAQALGRMDAAARDEAAHPLFARRVRYGAIRPLLDALYAPRPPELDDATLVCRCEDVTAGQVRQAGKQGCVGLNQLKAFTRCGMGPCQGRMCGSTAAEVLAQARGVAVAAIKPYRPRFPTKPVTVGELAALGDDP